MEIRVEHNDGIISFGADTKNTVIHAENVTPDWERLAAELEQLRRNPEPTMREFAAEAAEDVKKKDKAGLKKRLAKWLPHIGMSLETAYYIVEIATKFGIL